MGEHVRRGTVAVSVDCDAYYCERRARAEASNYDTARDDLIADHWVFAGDKVFCPDHPPTTVPPTTTPDPVRLYCTRLGQAVDGDPNQPCPECGIVGHAPLPEDVCGAYTTCSAPFCADNRLDVGHGHHCTQPVGHTGEHHS